MYLHACLAVSAKAVDMARPWKLLVREGSREMDSQEHPADDQHDQPAPVRRRAWRRWREVTTAASHLLAGLPGRAAPVLEQRERRLLGWEVVVVLGVFPLASGVVPGLVGLVSGWLSGGTASGGYYQVSLPDHVGLSLPLDLFGELVGFVPAALVAYLLARSGEGLAGIGLDRRRLRHDLGLLFTVVTVAYLGPMLAGEGLLAVVGLEGFKLASRVDAVTPPTVYLLVAWLAGVGAGVVEELVVLGYLVHRLEQLGWRAWQLVAAAVLVRVSFHAYYGPGIVWVIAWAAASVLLYRRVRRLLPFILVHALWDIQAATSDFVSDETHVLVFGYFLLGLIVVSAVAKRRESPSQAETAAS
jgi:membrane protease YdiL (CAAX protease family)